MNGFLILIPILVFKKKNAQLDIALLGFPFFEGLWASPKKSAQSNLNPKTFFREHFFFWVLEWKLGGNLSRSTFSLSLCVFLLVGLFLGMLLGRCCCGGGDGGGDPPPPPLPPAVGSCAPA
jgi:hypothetical protein